MKPILWASSVLPIPDWMGVVSPSLVDWTGRSKRLLRLGGVTCWVWRGVTERGAWMRPFGMINSPIELVPQRLMVGGDGGSGGGSRVWSRYGEVWEGWGVGGGGEGTVESEGEDGLDWGYAAVAFLVAGVDVDIGWGWRSDGIDVFVLIGGDGVDDSASGERWPVVVRFGSWPLIGFW